MKNLDIEDLALASYFRRSRQHAAECGIHFDQPTRGSGVEVDYDRRRVVISNSVRDLAVYEYHFRRGEPVFRDVTGQPERETVDAGDGEPRAAEELGNVYVGHRRVAEPEESGRKYDKAIYVVISKRPRWTPAAVDRFLGEPDLLSAYRRRGAAPARLFRLSRVEAVESTEEWSAWCEGSAKRRSSSQFGAERRAEAHEQAMDEFIAAVFEACRLTPPKIPLARLETEAGVSLSGLEGDLRLHRVRKIVSHLRHQYTNYDDVREALRLSPRSQSDSRHLAHSSLHRRVNGEIVKVYPELRAGMTDEEVQKHLVEPKPSTHVLS